MPDNYWVRETGIPGDAFGMTREQLKEFEGRRVRIALVYEGVLERADYGNEFVVRDWCMRYLPRNRIEYIEEK